MMPSKSSGKREPPPLPGARPSSSRSNRKAWDQAVERPMTDLRLDGHLVLRPVRVVDQLFRMSEREAPAAPVCPVSVERSHIPCPSASAMAG